MLLAIDHAHGCRVEADVHRGVTSERELKSLGIPDGLLGIAFAHELRDFLPIREPPMRDRDNCEEEASLF